MEYVFVAGPEDRDVVVDGQVAGKTKTVIMIPTGTHEFSLRGPENYKPVTKLAVVSDTSSISPLQIHFETA